MKLYVIFDPAMDPADLNDSLRFERRLEAVVEWLQAQDEPAAFHVHEHRIGDDADTILCVLNREFCWPDPIRAWRGTNRGTLRVIKPPRTVDDPTDRLQAAEAARGA